MLIGSQSTARDMWETGIAQCRVEGSVYTCSALLFDQVNQKSWCSCLCADTHWLGGNLVGLGTASTDGALSRAEQYRSRAFQRFTAQSGGLGRGAGDAPSGVLSQHPLQRSTRQQAGQPGMAAAAAPAGKGWIPPVVPAAADRRCTGTCNSSSATPSLPTDWTGSC